MKRLLLTMAVLGLLVPAAVASAHPLGNFTTNQFTRVDAAGDRVYVVHVLDLAEVPTFQDRAALRRLGRDAYARRLAETVRRGLRLSVDGEPATLSAVRLRLAFPAGAAGLRTTRLEVVLSTGRLASGLRRVELESSVFPERRGWREIVASARDGAELAHATVLTESVSRELRSYPENLLDEPLDQRNARLRAELAKSPAAPPALSPAPGTATPYVPSATESGFASLITEDDLSLGVLLASLAIALFWGAAHALTPGHGKAIVAAYMVGTRARTRDALLLGLTVTVTHTIGVFALGLVTLALSELFVPDDLYPWLNLVSALLVVGVGVAVLRARVQSARADRGTAAHGHHAHGHAQHHHHTHGHGHDHHSHGHGHGHGYGDHHHPHGQDGHGHSHVPEPGSGLRGLIAVGVSGGILPCPTALVVLLAAISLHRVGLGLALIVAFSIGLAAVISGIALLAVTAKRAFTRMSFDGRFVRALPAASALVILVVGVAMTLRAVPSVL